MNKQADVIAISDLSADAAGAIVLWRLSGDTSYDRLKAAFAAVGLDERLLPELPSAEVALRRAVKEHESKHVLVRSLPGRATGWALVAEQVKAPSEQEELDPLAYAVSFQVRLHKNPNELAFSHPNNPIAHKISADFRMNLERLESGDTAGWLCQMVRHVKAIPLRDTGGVYFVPRETLGVWRQIANAVRDASASYVAEIPALRSAEALSTILDSLLRESAHEIELLERDLTAEREMGKRAVGTRISRCASLEEKLGTYERLLGTQLVDVRAKLETLNAGFASAMLIANADWMEDS